VRQQHRTVSRFVAGFGLAAFTLLLSVAAGAHALLVKSEPPAGEPQAQAPSRITAWYSQELETRTSSMRVFDAEGRQVDEGDGGVDLDDPDHASMVVTLPEQLPPGTYAVRWMAVSAEDGDPTEGEFSIAATSGEASSKTEPAPAAHLRLGGFTWIVGGTAAGLGVLLVSGWRSARNKRRRTAERG
jgi:methionine-rich copper-binding protein CopC